MARWCDFLGHGLPLAGRERTCNNHAPPHFELQEPSLNGRGGPGLGADFLLLSSRMLRDETFVSAHPAIRPRRRAGNQIVRANS